MKVFRIVIDTYESAPYPIVSHTFQGSTEEQARAFVRAHQKTDEFFRGCGSGRWKTVKCRNVVAFAGWVNLDVT
jgi:hypothetical protein